MGVALAIWEFLDQCERPYLTRSIDTFVGLLRGCERRGDCVSADAVLRHMADFHVAPTAYVYNLVMQTYGKAGMVKPALRLMQVRPHLQAPQVIGI